MNESTSSKVTTDGELITSVETVTITTEDSVDLPADVRALFPFFGALGSIAAGVFIVCALIWG